MAHAIRFHRTGGPEVLAWEEVEVGEPGPGEARVRHRAVGLNYVDTYIRSGLYPVERAERPRHGGCRNRRGRRPGRHRREGRRPRGLFGRAPRRLRGRARHAGRSPGVVPDGISDEQAAAMMLKGMTVQYLIRQIYRVEAGRYHPVPRRGRRRRIDRVPVGQVPRRHASSAPSAATRRRSSRGSAAATTPIVYTRENFVDRVREITGGAMLPVVYDSVGKDTFLSSLDCLRPRGLMVSFGQSSGAIGPVDLGILSQKGSLFLTRPTLEKLRRPAPRTPGDGEGPVRRRAVGGRADRDQPDLSAAGRRQGARGSARPQDHRVDHPHGVGPKAPGHRREVPHSQACEGSRRSPCP